MTEDTDKTLWSALRTLEHEAPETVTSAAGIKRSAHKDRAEKTLKDALTSARKVVARRPSKPVLRTLHHLACTGGTLISKAISAQPNVALLSEVDPFTPLRNAHTFRPTDMIGLAKMGSRGATLGIQAKIFQASVDLLAQESDGQGIYLVLRDHSHGKYTYGNDIDPHPGIRTLLGDAYDLKSVVTVRNPIDSYLSIKTNGWDKFSPDSFDEYCRRMLVFLDDYAGLPVIRYEDFVTDPHTVGAALCDALHLPFNPDFVDLMSAINLSGDSGRKGIEIRLRARRPVSEDLASEFMHSAHFARLAKRLGYPRDPERSA